MNVGHHIQLHLIPFAVHLVVFLEALIVGLRCFVNLHFWRLIRLAYLIEIKFLEIHLEYIVIYSTPYSETPPFLKCELVYLLVE
jgi:hypothetical protein